MESFTIVGQAMVFGPLSPAAQLSVPLTAVKSDPAIAVSARVE